MTSIFHKARIAAVFGLIALAVPGAASAQTAWQHHHPARAEINHRVRHQEHQITRERREGKITAGQAHALRAQDRAIRKEERADARANHAHGHLTRGQAHALNGQLNANHRAIEQNR